MRVVACNPDALGDFVLRQPFYAALHAAGHDVLLIIRPALLPLASHVAPFAKVVALPADPYKGDVTAIWDRFDPLVKTISDFRPDLIVVASYYWTNFEEKLASVFSAVRLAGMSGRHAGVPPPNGLQQPGGRAFNPLAAVAEESPELEKNQALACAILNTDAVLPNPMLSLTDAARESAQRELNRLGLSPGNYYLVCVGGTTNVSIKTWPAERWAEVLSAWMEKHAARILFTGLKSEEPGIDAVRAQMGEARSRTFQWIDESGARIETLLGLIGLSNGYVGHDTGPMHLAAALGKPVLAIFGGGHWPRFIPAVPSARIITAGVTCVGCGWNCPFEKAYCVQAIPAPDVLAALNDLSVAAEARREIRVLKLAPEISAAMLDESARIAARQKRDLYVKNIAMAQLDGEVAALRALVHEHAAAAVKLRQLNDLSWHERIWDTMKCIAYVMIFGRPRIRRPEPAPLPSITVVTPVLNGAEHIRSTIESILSQNYPHLNYIVVDGGSTDGTTKILDEYRGRVTKIISEPDNGKYDALAKGFNASDAEIFAHLNVGDLYEPGALLRVGGYFRDHPNAAAIYHENTVSSNGWRFANVAQPRVDMFYLLRGRTLFPDGVFFRRKTYLAVGGVNRKLRRAGDYALWLEMALWFKLQRVPGHVSSFRVRSGQISANIDAHERERNLARIDFRTRLGAKRFLWRVPRHAWNKCLNLTERMFRKREFFYPVDFPNTPPPPGHEPDVRASAPSCPLSGQPPDRLLLSARHPMLGAFDINRIYFNENSRIAINDPAPDAEQSARLRAQRFTIPPVDWTHPPKDVVAPAAPFASPFAKSRMRGSIVEKLLRKIFTASFRPNIEFPTPMAAIVENSIRDLSAIFDPNDTTVRVLDAMCFGGEWLDAISAQTKWQRAGLETDATLAAAARSRGHRIVECAPSGAPFAFPTSERFDIIHAGSALPFLSAPVTTLNALKTLLAPGGVLTIGSPNLDSKQLEWFGPAWAHWHLTRFHALYSRRAFERLAELTGMEIRRSRSFSHMVWTAVGMHLQVHGLAWSVPNPVGIPESAIDHAGRLERLVENVWDYCGHGDYLSAILRAK